MSQTSPMPTQDNSPIVLTSEQAKDIQSAIRWSRIANIATTAAMVVIIGLNVWSFFASGDSGSAE